MTNVGNILIYFDCQDLELAMTLVKPSRLYPKEMEGKDLLTKERYGSMKRVFIVCEGDNVVPEEIQRWMISNYEPNEVKVVEVVADEDDPSRFPVTSPSAACAE